MRRNRSSLLSDLSLLLFLLLCFVTIIYVAADPNRYMQNLIFLNIAFLFVIVTYFTTVTAGLVLNIAFIFGYGSFVLYQTVSQAETIGTGTYYWLVMTPLFTMVMWMFTSASRQLQAENEQLNQQKDRLATLDENTDLKNSLSFQKDASVFTGISIRYNIPLTLLVVKVKYWNEIRKLIPAAQMTDTILDISKISQASIRTNDTLYMLDNEDATWGLLLFTDKEGSKIVTDRIRHKLYEFNTKDFADKYKVKLILKIGAMEYNADTVSSPLDFIEQAKKQLEYDV
jgi:GGDEF domain-containing protein